jgi:hypothetical protein
MSPWDSCTIGSLITDKKGDYADLVRFTIDDVQPWIEEARTFVDALAMRILQALQQSNP